MTTTDTLTCRQVLERFDQDELTVGEATTLLVQHAEHVDPMPDGQCACGLDLDQSTQAALR